MFNVVALGRGSVYNVPVKGVVVDVEVKSKAAGLGIASWSLGNSLMCGDCIAFPGFSLTRR